MGHMSFNLFVEMILQIIAWFYSGDFCKIYLTKFLFTFNYTLNFQNGKLMEYFFYKYDWKTELNMLGKSYFSLNYVILIGVL